MPPEKAGYTDAIEPTAANRLIVNEEESLYGRLLPIDMREPSATTDTGIKGSLNSEN